MRTTSSLEFELDSAYEEVPGAANDAPEESAMYALGAFTSWASTNRRFHKSLSLWLIHCLPGSPQALVRCVRIRLQRRHADASADDADGMANLLFVTRCFCSVGGGLIGGPGCTPEPQNPGSISRDKKTPGSFRRTTSSVPRLGDTARHERSTRAARAQHHVRITLT